MKTLVTGHRLFKLECYDIDWIKWAIEEALLSTFLSSTTYGLSGMASGVDLWFCQTCTELKIPFAACIPFEGQENCMEAAEKIARQKLLTLSAAVHYIKNSAMLARSDVGLVIWDGNKGGTHNVVQQLVENKMPFVWVNPVNEKIWELV